ncbi:unnamed protein product [Rhizophagus irregularis]|nr:unnamed protein product [Rhizophagus irregularis]
MNSFPKKILTNTTHLIISKSLKLSSSEQILQATSSAYALADLSWNMYTKLGSLKFEKKLEFVIAKNQKI